MTRPDLDALAALHAKATPGGLTVETWEARCALLDALPALLAYVRELERERDAAALAMRERAAQACEERALIYDGLESGASTRYFSDKMRGARTAAEECAAAIRALGE